MQCLGKWILLPRNIALSSVQLWMLELVAGWKGSELRLQVMPSQHCLISHWGFCLFVGEKDLLSILFPIHLIAVLAEKSPESTSLLRDKKKLKSVCGLAGHQGQWNTRYADLLGRAKFIYSITPAFDD